MTRNGTSLILKKRTLWIQGYWEFRRWRQCAIQL